MPTNPEIDIIKDIHNWNKYMSNYFLDFDIRKYNSSHRDKHDIFCWVSALLHEGYTLNNINSIIRNSGFKMEQKGENVILKNYNNSIILDIGKYF